MPEWAPYTGINRKVFKKTRIIKRFIFFKKLEGRIKFLSSEYILQKCLKNEIGLEIGYLTISPATKEKNKKYLDWYDSNWSEKQTFFLRCSECENELTSSGSWVSSERDIVKYQCTDCGKETTWNFGACPFPIEIETISQKLAAGLISG